MPFPSPPPSLPAYSKANENEEEGRILVGPLPLAMKILALAFVLAVAGCTHDERLPEQPAAATAQIRSWIPVGTSLPDARRILEQHHFNCSIKTNRSFGDLKGIDFIYGDRRDPDS